MTVILLNPFEVPAGREDEALDYWERCAEVMRKAPGYISTRLHRAISPDARFHYINMAEWESPQHFLAVVESDEQASGRRGHGGIPALPRPLRGHPNLR